jgi:hypothetical protein
MPGRCKAQPEALPLCAIAPPQITVYSLPRSMWTVFAGAVHVLAAPLLAWWRGFFLAWKRGLENSKLPHDAWGILECARAPWGRFLFL